MGDSLHRESCMQKGTWSEGTVGTVFSAALIPALWAWTVELPWEQRRNDPCPGELLQPVVIWRTPKLLLQANTDLDLPSELWARLFGAQSVGSRLIPWSSALLSVLSPLGGELQSAGSSYLRHALLTLWSNASVSLLNNCDWKPSLIRPPCLPSSKGWSLSISEKLIHLWSCLRTLELLSLAFININSISNLLPNRYSLLL